MGGGGTPGESLISWARALRLARRCHWNPVGHSPRSPDGGGMDGLSLGLGHVSITLPAEVSATLVSSPTTHPPLWISHAPNPDLGLVERIASWMVAL